MKKTPIKEMVDKKAIVHPLASSSLMNPAIDDPEELKKYTKNIYNCFSPKNDLEIFFVNRAISCMWRLKRVINIEEAIFKQEIDAEKGFFADQIFNYIKDKMSVINKYEKSLESSLFKTLKELKKIQSE